MPCALLSCSFVALLYCYCFLNEINGDGDIDLSMVVEVGGKCPTPCKNGIVLYCKGYCGGIVREGEMSGSRGNVT